MLMNPAAYLRTGLVCCLTDASSLAHAALPSPMMGRQSHNTGIRAVPAPGAVKIDGDLSDWDFSGRIWSFADIAIRDRYSAQTAAMWDKDYLYLAVKFTDPAKDSTPSVTWSSSTETVPSLPEKTKAPSL